MIELKLAIISYIAIGTVRAFDNVICTTIMHRMESCVSCTHISIVDTFLATTTKPFAFTIIKLYTLHF